MASFEALPADQRAVLQLLLRQRKSYEEIAQMLRISDDAVRARAHGALGALGPDDGAGLSPDERAGVADYLLGQGDADRRLGAYALLEDSPAARAWARVVAGELRPVVGDSLPDVPAEGSGAAPAATPAPATPGAPDGAASGGLAGLGPARPRSSKVGGLLLIGAVLAAVAVALVLLLSGGDDDKDKDKDKAADKPATTTTAANPQVEAQVNLTPPESRKSSKALGVVQIVRVEDRRAINAVVDGLPTPPEGSGYGIWLTGTGKNEWLGFFQNADEQGRLIAQGALESDVNQFTGMLVTRERGRDPKKPGTVFLRGPIQAPSGQAGSGSSGSGTTTDGSG